MNLTDLSNYVCQKAQLVESSDITACQLFLSKRYELIYNSYFWKDSLAMVDVSFDPVNNLDNAAGIVLLPQLVDRLAAIRTANNSVRIQGLEHYYRIDWDSFGAGGTCGFAPSEMSILNPIWLSIRSNIGAITIQSTNNAASPAGDASAQVKVVWRDSSERYVTTATLPITLTPVAGATFVEIEAIFKPVTIGSLQVVLGNNTLGTLQPSDLQSPSYQRVRIFPIPTAAITLNVLGKRPFVPLTFPTEIPALRNLDNCLIAFGMADMFTRARFPAEEAAPFMQEGGVLLKELALLEALQAAHCSMIEPETGFGNGVGYYRTRGFGSFGSW